MPLSEEGTLLESRPRRALEAFSRAAIAHTEVAGLILYGSALWKADPADLDFVVLLDKTDYTHFYGVHAALGLRCEVEYVTPPVLDEYLQYPHWRVANWELDVGAKFVHGRILHDRRGSLSAFVKRLTGPDEQVLRVRRYLFVHQLGQAASRLQKLVRAEAQAGEEGDTLRLRAEFVGALDAAAHHARQSYPQKMYKIEGWSLSARQREELTGPGELVAKEALLNEIRAYGLRSLGFDREWADCPDAQSVLQKVPIFHLVDLPGLALLLALARPDLHLPADLMMPLFSGAYPGSEPQE